MNVMSYLIKGYVALIHIFSDAKIRDNFLKLYHFDENIEQIKLYQIIV